MDSRGGKKVTDFFFDMLPLLYSDKWQEWKQISHGDYKYSMISL